MWPTSSAAFYEQNHHHERKAGAERVIEVRPAPREHYPWIAERAKLVIGSSFKAIEAVSGHRILAMVGYDGWTPNSCCTHIAVDEPISLRRLLPEAIALPFRLGRDVIVASVLSTNKRSLRLVRHIGFTPLATIAEGWDKGVDVHLFEMRRESCRWVG